MVGSKHSRLVRVLREGWQQGAVHREQPDGGTGVVLKLLV